MKSYPTAPLLYRLNPRRNHFHFRQSRSQHKNRYYVAYIIIITVTLIFFLLMLQQWTNHILNITNTTQSKNTRSQLSQKRNDPPETLIIYSGPTDMNPHKGKNDMYLKNFDYYLSHGIDCADHDTVLVLTPSVATAYASRINDVIITNGCDGQDRGGRVVVVLRDDHCRDMESFRMALHNVDFNPYDYIIVLNCGVVGPKHASLAVSSQPWTRHFTSLLSPHVKLAGLSINCATSPHVQSFLWVMDRTGLEVIKRSAAVFDCRGGGEAGRDTSLEDIIQQYEVGASRAILDAGYGIAAHMSSLGGPLVVSPTNQSEKDLLFCHDIWVEFQPAPIRYESFPKWEETMFWKVSRFVTDDIVDEMRYEHYLL